MIHKNSKDDYQMIRFDCCRYYSFAVILYSTTILAGWAIAVRKIWNLLAFFSSVSCESLPFCTLDLLTRLCHWNTGILRSKLSLWFSPCLLLSDWLFVLVKVDNVGRPSWQAQIRGIKKWTLAPPPECSFECTSMDVTVHPNDISEFSWSDALDCMICNTKFYVEGTHVASGCGTVF